MIGNKKGYSCLVWFLVAVVTKGVPPSFFSPGPGISFHATKTE